METLQDLKGLVRGEVVAKGEARYVSLRGGLLYNRRSPDRQPAVIVRARDERDVQAVVRYAAANDLTVSPCGSGHNWSGIAMQEGIVLDLSGLNQLAIDSSARTAEVGPALANRTMARRLAEHGLAFPLGHCGHVSLGGYLLGGGLGWNSERWGLGCHNVIGIDVVTADGTFCRASADDNPDLFWAARGGGPAFFGVVTRYRLALHPLPRAITTSNRFYPLSRIREIQAWMLAAKGALPDNVEFSAVFAAPPPDLETCGRHVVLATATIFADTTDEANASLATLAALAPDRSLKSEVVPSGFEDLFLPFDTLLPEGRRYAVDSLWSAAPTDDFMAAFAEQIAEAPSATCTALSVVVPAPTEEPMPTCDTAFSMTGSGFGLIYAVWDDPANDEEHVAWLRSASDALARETVGRYVGEADLARAGWLQTCYAPDAWARLSGLRDHWDARGVFDRPELERQQLRLAG